MSDVRRVQTDLTRLPSPVYKQINPKQGVFARAVLKENAKFMLVMENEACDDLVKEAYSSQPGKCRGRRPMHISTLSLEHEETAPTASYSRHFSSKKQYKRPAKLAAYPSQFTSQISLEHTPRREKIAGDTTNKSSFKHWDSSKIRAVSRENNKENMRSGTNGADVVFEKLDPEMYDSTYCADFM